MRESVRRAGVVSVGEGDMIARTSSDVLPTESGADSRSLSFALLPPIFAARARELAARFFLCSYVQTGRSVGLSAVPRILHIPTFFA